MKIAVAGLWHLGTVYAACLASCGHDVVAFDDPARIAELRAGHLPVAEPGLAELFAQGVSQGRLRLVSSLADLAESELVWVCYDTPVDSEGRADSQFVIDRIADLIAAAKPSALILVSSQVPVGTVRRLRSTYSAICIEKAITFGYSPENLRLGSAISYFMNPDRIVVGLEFEDDRTRVLDALIPFTSNIVFMSVASAEMVKHALNGFFATSVAFINEIAMLCEKVGADCVEVERGLKSDMRIGSKAYLHPGGAFAGGTLLRDLMFLMNEGESRGLEPFLLRGVLQSNTYHASWTSRKVQSILGDLHGSKIAVLGLTYKPGTNTLRGSTSVDFCEWAAKSGAEVCAYDPAVTVLPETIDRGVQLCASAADALVGADVAIVNTPWPDFLELTVSDFMHSMKVPRIIDGSRFLESKLRSQGMGAIEYIGIGVPGKEEAKAK